MEPFKADDKIEHRLMPGSMVTVEDAEPWEQDAGTLERVLAIIRNVDKWLDAEVSAGYQGQPLAQDWARVAKVAEEVGEGDGFEERLAAYRDAAAATGGE